MNRHKIQFSGFLAPKPCGDSCTRDEIPVAMLRPLCSPCNRPSPGRVPGCSSFLLTRSCPRYFADCVLSVLSPHNILQSRRLMGSAFLFFSVSCTCVLNGRRVKYCGDIGTI